MIYKKTFLKREDSKWSTAELKAGMLRWLEELHSGEIPWA